MYTAQDVFIKYFKFYPKGNIPDVETNTEKTSICTSRHAVFSIAFSTHEESAKLRRSGPQWEAHSNYAVATASFPHAKCEPYKAIKPSSLQHQAEPIQGSPKSALAKPWAWAVDLNTGWVLDMGLSHKVALLPASSLHCCVRKN